MKTTLQELLDAPETPEEKAVLDELERDPEEVLRLARQRAEAYARSIGSGSSSGGVQT